MKKYKIVLCGCEGHVDKFGTMINSYEESVTIGCWDSNRKNAENVSTKVGSNCKVYETYEDVLSDPYVDGIVLVTGTKFHTEQVIAAAKAKKHLFVEHPLCLGYENALLIQNAVKESGVKFFMSDPMVNAPEQYVKNLIGSGKLGKIRSLRYRECANDGPNAQSNQERAKRTVEKMGGGVMFNTGLHAFHLTQYLLGSPVSIHSIFKYANDEVKAVNHDNGGSFLLEFPNGVVGYLELGLGLNYTNSLEIQGTEGVAVVRDRQVYYRIKNEVMPEKPILDNGYPAHPKDISEWVKVSPDELPPAPEDHVRYWVNMMANGIPNEQVGIDPMSTHGLSLDDAVKLVSIHDALIAAADAPKTIIK